MRSINTVSLLVRDYDEAINFYTQKLGFELVQDIELPNQNKRWVIIRPMGVEPKSRDTSLASLTGCQLLLARANSEEQRKMIGNQTGGRVFLFLNTDDFWRDHRAMKQAGVEFQEEPRQEIYGIVAVFRDLYGNLWDLIQPF